MTEFRMNSPEGKAILALARDGDYAHPGEEEALRLAAGLVDRAGIQRIMDVGCGRGGTADWFGRQGWGEVIGVDLDATSIEHARRQYPSQTFFVQDVSQLATLHLAPFDLIYLITSFYAFPDQPLALHQMHQVCRPGGTLLIVDYTLRAGQTVPSELGDEIGQPIVLDALADTLAECGWSLSQQEDWTARFTGWYAALLYRFNLRRHVIIELAGIEWFDFVMQWYGALHQALLDQRLGGVAFTAKASG
ncbi:MAG: class I SAM-dependent methyltransferase [Methylococcaceae bacterium]|nr:class I SAM-dependent methyltransferase [Methylococcaceae bacterium]